MAGFSGRTYIATVLVLVGLTYAAQSQWHLGWPWGLVLYSAIVVLSCLWVLVDYRRRHKQRPPL